MVHAGQGGQQGQNNVTYFEGDLLHLEFIFFNTYDLTIGQLSQYNLKK